MKLNYSILPITKEEVKDGDIFVTRSDTFLSRMIREFMLEYSREIGIKCSINDLYSHAGSLFWENGKLVIYEADVRIKPIFRNGYQKSNFDDVYKFGPDNAILRYEPGFTSEQVALMKAKAEQLRKESKSYQFWNFLQWISVIWFHNKKAFDKNTDQFTYCYEGAYKVEHTGLPEVFPNNGEKTSLFDLYLNRVRYLVTQ